MTTKNFKVKNGIDIGDNISINDDGTLTGNIVSDSDLTVVDLNVVDVIASGDVGAVNGNFTGNVGAVDGNFTGDLVIGDLSSANRMATGPIRQAAAETNNAVFQTGVNTYKGISIDNANDLNARSTLLQRSYGFKGGGPYIAQVYEAARGTAAAPARLNNNDSLFTTLGYGYFDDLAGSANWSADATGYPPFIMRARAADNWTSATNSPTKLEVLQLPSGAAQAYSYWTTADIGTSYIKFRSQSHQLADGNTNNLILTTSYDSGNNATVIQGNRSQLVLKNDSFIVKNNSDTQTLSVDSAGNLSMLADIDAVNGDFTGDVGAVNGNFTGDINALTGNVGAIDGNFTGDLVVSDLSSAKRMAMGPIRQTVANDNEDILWYNITTGAVKFRGLSVNNADGSNTPTRRPTVLLRAYNTNSTYPAVVSEASRGTEAAPTQVNNNDTLLALISSAYLGDVGTGSPGWNMDAGLNNPSIIRVRAAESFTTKSNVSTKFEVLQFPSGADSASSANYIVTMSLNPTSSNFSTDFFKINNTVNNTGQTALYLERTNVTNGLSHLPAFSFRSLRSATGSLSGDVLGEFKFNGAQAGNTATATPPAAIRAIATENYSPTTLGSKVVFQTIKNGTTTIVAVIEASADTTTFRSDNVYIRDAAGTLLCGSSVNYSRQYITAVHNTSITGITANTVHEFPFDTTVASNGISIANTSEITFTNTGWYNLQFSLQWDNTDNGNDHNLYIWLKKNGSDVADTAGRITCNKNFDDIKAWNYLVEVTTVGDYYELAYAVDNTAIEFPYVAAQTSPFAMPAIPAIIVTVVPVGI